MGNKIQRQRVYKKSAFWTIWESLPAPTFNEIFDANDDGTICPQIEEFNYTLTGVVDCLDLNVYVPSSASDDHVLPVMVYIYGGRYTIGFAGQYVYGPQYLVRHDVILVTLNYRLGAYGWMCLDTPSVPGNSGLKDQRKALRWVKENIAAFGGDINSITIFGNSAGSHSVEFHLLSPYSGDLFHRAILQSGSVLSQGVIKSSQPRMAIDLIEYFGYNAATPEEAISILKDISSDDMVLAADAIGLAFGPCVENNYEGVESIISDIPENIMSGGTFNSIPIIQGYNSQENMISPMLNQNSESYYERIGDTVLNKLNASYGFADDKVLNDVSRVLHEFYFGTYGINRDTLYDLINFDSDIAFVSAIERSVAYQLNVAASPVYQYVFAYSGEINFVKAKLNITEGGAAHADEIAYLFKQSYLPDGNNAEDQLTIDRMTTMWTNFAKYGNPTPATTSLLPVLWRPASEERAFLWIDRDLELQKKPFQRRVAMWDLIFEAYKQNYRFQ